ncbi:MAG: FCD domain-containing protein [Hyphomicrobiaceae bacterium]|jgi:GntR family transcriptional regulator, transcriptional repressor for pyruvate dehydrogenase complex
MKAVTGDRQALVKALLRQVEDARRTPGIKLPGERELASSFGASRTSVREVLGVLEALRVIERRPQSGIYVRSADSDASIEALVLQEAHDVRATAASYEQAQEARVLHEVEAVRLAAKRRTRADLVAMREIIDVSREHLERGVNLADDDEAFHLALIAAAKNDILLRMAKSLYLMTRAVRQAYFDAPGHAAPSVAEHDLLLDSVEARDSERAAQFMRKHYAGSSARWRKVHAAVQRSAPRTAVSR